MPLIPYAEQGIRSIQVYYNSFQYFKCNKPLIVYAEHGIRTIKVYYNSY